MDIFDILYLIGGLCLFLFGMNIMGESLEKSAGGSLSKLLERLTSGKIAGFLTGLAVTSVIQSSSATTVMVVGFVNSGIMSLKQAINVIMGANVGTTVTAWLLSLTGIDGSSLFVKLLKPMSFTPVLALVGIILIMAAKSSRKKDIGSVLLGFAVLMFGMDIMSDAVSGLKEVTEFRNILLMFSNPVLGVLAGAVLTGIIQSSSASVGILQALSSTGAVTIGSAIPIIMGQNIGTCVTAMISSVGTTTNARRAAIVHLSFNIIGTVVCLALFSAAKAIFAMPMLDNSASEFSIAICHSAFNIFCTALLLPMSGLLEKLACKIIKDPKVQEVESELDERLMATPSIAVSRCRIMSEAMAVVSGRSIREAMKAVEGRELSGAEKVREYEAKADHYEDLLGTYLVRLSAEPMSRRDSDESAKLLHVIGDLERISDHAVNLIESVEEMKSKEIEFSDKAKREISVLIGASREIVDLAIEAYLYNDIQKAEMVEPLEELIDTLKEQLRMRHILRLQRGECSIEAGFVWSDLITNMERVSDHCSNIAVCLIEMSRERLDLHEYLDGLKIQSSEFAKKYEYYASKYALVSE